MMNGKFNQLNSWILTGGGHTTTPRSEEKGGLFSSSSIKSLRSSCRGSSLPRLPPEFVE